MLLWSVAPASHRAPMLEVNVCSVKKAPYACPYMSKAVYLAFDLYWLKVNSNINLVIYSSVMEVSSTHSPLGLTTSLESLSSVSHLYNPLSALSSVLLITSLSFRFTVIHVSSSQSRHKTNSRTKYHFIQPQLMFSLLCQASSSTRDVCLTLLQSKES